jgi:ferritin-like metal-binding protein YciE
MNERDTRLVQWLNEAHAKEAQLEGDLNAHIRLTQKTSYKKRLQDHLKETRDHKRRVASRIKKLGGTPATGPGVPGVPTIVGEAAGLAVSAVKGQVGAARAAITEQAETHMRNAQEELREEHVEIALYTRIETFADEVGDGETAQLARSIRRDEERMAKFLDAELVRQVKAVVRADVPTDQRPTASRGRRRKSTRSKPRASSSRSTSRSSSSRSTGGSSSSRSSSSGSGRRSSTSGRASSSRSSGGGRSSSSSGRSSSSRSSSGRRSSS